MKNVTYIQKKQNIAGYLEGFVKDGDLVITMGAGDIHVIGRELFSRLREKHKNAIV